MRMFLPSCVLKTNCDPHDDLRQSETCGSIKWIKCSYIWRDVDPIYYTFTNNMKVYVKIIYAYL
jgi:hypothetical protein